MRFLYMKENKNKMRALIMTSFLALSLFLLPVFSRAQFVEEPEVQEPANSVAVASHNQVNKVFDLLIIFSALIFVVSVMGFIIGFIKLVISEGDEKEIEEANNILVLSGWVFGASIAIYLLVNVIKFFVY